LEECIKTIQKNNIHRLIVKDKKTDNLAGFITYETIFEYFIENYYSEMTEFNVPLKQINLVVNNIITLNKNETLYKCMETFYKEGISMLPILDDGKIFGYFYLKDIIYFFSMGEKFNFNNTIESFLKDLYEDIDNEMPYGKRRINELNDDTNLKNVFELMNISPERKLIVKYNNDDTKIGIIALYDIFKRLVV
jgi:predicted transcriptional regulator